MKWRTDIQGLRAIAVLGVVLFHAGVPLIDGGFTGVDVFFVISGFLITGMLFPPIEGPTRSIPSFLTSRVRRLLPASILTLIVVTFVTWLTIDPLQRTEIFKQIRFAALQVSNIAMARDSNDYLAGDTALNPVMHFWTLGLEWQYYLLWALVVAICILLFRKSRSALRAAITIMLVVLFVGTLSASIIVTPIDPGPSYFLLTTRAWEFSIGGIVFLSGPWIAKRLTTFARNFLAVIGVVGIIASFFVINSTTTFPGYAALLPTVATALVIVAGSKPLSTGVSRLFDNPVAQRIGATSYSWYLWHWPFLVFPLLWWGDRPLWINLVLVALSYLAAELSYTFIEQPARYKFPALKRAVLALPLAIVVMVATAGLGAALKPLPSPADGDLAAVIQAEAISKETGTPYTDGCHRSLKSTNAKPCYYGDLNSNTLVVLWGDSHAGHWFLPFEEAAIENHWKIAYYTKSACSVMDPTATNLEVSESCKQWQQESQRRIIASKPNLVVIGGRWQRPSWLVVADGDPSQRVSGLRVGDTEAAVGLRKTTVALNDAKIETVLLEDNPLPPGNIPRCVAKNGLTSTACDWPIPSTLGVTEEAAARGLPYVHVVNLNEYLCPNGKCKAIVNGSITIRDDHHLSEPFARTLAGPLGKDLERYLN